MTIRRFLLERAEDATGVSGTGVVAEGAQFSDGTTVLRWLGPNPSTVIWPDLAAAKAIHGHDGKTQFVQLDYATRPDHT